MDLSLKKSKLNLGGWQLASKLPLLRNKHWRTNIPSVAFSKTQDLSFLHLVIICPAYATDRRVSQTVKQD